MIDHLTSVYLCCIYVENRCKKHTYCWWNFEPQYINPRYVYYGEPEWAAHGCWITYVSVCHLVCLQLCSSVWIYAEEIADLHGWTGEVRVYRFTKTFAPNCFLISPRTQFLIPQLKIVPSKAPLESDHIINTHKTSESLTCELSWNHFNSSPPAKTHIWP